MSAISERMAVLGPRCRHYDPRAGIVNGQDCRIGFPIRKIVGEKAGTTVGLAYMLPCHPGPERQADCPSYDPKTEDEIAAERASVSRLMDETLKMIAAAPRWKRLMVAKGKATARANCPCCGGEGTVRLTCAIGNNRHLSANCSECSIGFRE